MDTEWVMKRWLKFQVVKCKEKEMGEINNPNFVCLVMGCEQDVAILERDLGGIFTEMSFLLTQSRNLWGASSLSRP